MELTAVAQLRRMVLEHLSRYTWNNELPDHVYDILQEVREDTPRYRCCVYKERAVLKNRIDMALGQECSSNIIEAAKLTLNEPERTDLPIIDVLPAACDQCPIDAYYVTDMCRHCITHKCMNNCPKKAITIIQDRAFIDKTKCIECGRCKQMCPYGAIIEIHRPCVRACAIGAISIGENRKAVIDHEKCVSCGACRNACPFGAIDERSNIIRVIREIQQGKQVIALVAPSIVGQYGLKITMAQIYEALQKAGFAEVVEVGVGADITSVKEAEEYLEKVPAKQGFMTSSCCPAFVEYVRKNHPEYMDHVSTVVSPMIAMARAIRAKDRKARIVFIGPCAAKKLEANRKSVRSDVDFVLTFEELLGMFDAKEIDFKTLEADPADGMDEGSGFGRGFAVGGGVAAAVVEAIKHIDPDREILIEYGDGLKECRKMLAMAKAGKRNGYLLEGMGCPGGCVAGAGTLRPVKESTASVERFKNAASSMSTTESPYLDRLKDVEEKC